MSILPDNPRVALVWLIATSALARLMMAAWLGLGVGEAYYVASAKHLSLSYFDQPPLSLWVIHAWMEFTGSTAPWVVRLPFILMFGGTTWVMFRLGSLLFGGWAGFYGALFLNLAPVFTLSVGSWVQPDGPLMFFLLLSALGFAKLAVVDTPKSQPLGPWLLIGTATGMAFLSKYPATFLPLGGFLYLVTSPRERRWLRCPGPYLALFIVALFFLPVLIWNLQHDFASFQFQGGRAFPVDGIRWDWLLQNLGGQALFLSPWLWIPLVGVLIFCWQHGPTDQPHWFTAMTATWPIVTFTLVSMWSPAGHHFHWQAPGYLMIFPALGAYVHHRLKLQSVSWRRWLNASTALSCLMVMMVVSHAATGWVIRAVFPQDRWEEIQRKDESLELLDWSPLEAALEKRGWLDRDDLVLATHRWYLAGKLEHGVRGRAPVLCLHPDARNLAQKHDRKDYLGKDAIVIVPADFVDSVKHELAPSFHSLDPVGTIELSRGGYPALTLVLLYGTSLAEPLPWPVWAQDPPKKPLSFDGDGTGRQ